MNIYQPVISGSLTVTGSTTFIGNITINSGSLTMTSGSLTGTASLASNSLLLQGTGSIGFATTASMLEVSSSQQQISSSLLQVSASYISLSGSYTTFSGSNSTILTAVSSSQQQISASLLNVVANYATTGSNSFRADQSITGSLVVSSTITAQTLVVQTITSSIDFVTGSTRFGSLMTNTHTFTGSVNITGSLIVNTTGTEFQVNNSGVVMGNLSTDNHAITGSLNMTGSLGINAASSFRFNGVGDNSHAVGYDTTVDGAFLRGQNGIRLITGGGSGIERMRISAAGTASFTGNSLTSAADAATINLKQNSTTANTGIYLERSGEQKGYYIYVGGSADSLTFQRNNAGTKADVMSLTRDGNVGIGVTNPQRQFVIADSSGNGLEISNSSGYSTLLAYNRTTSAYQNIVLGEGTGKVGIGITNPSYKLQVRPTTDVNMIVTNNGANLQIGSSNDAGNAATILNFTATSFTFNNDVTFSTNISLGANQRVKLSGGAGNLTGSGQTTISSTIATIFSGFLLGGVQTGNLVIVNGVKSGTGWNFTDLVNYMTNGTITVISSSTVNTPPARTYTVSGNDLRLSIAGGDTGFVSCTALTQGYQA